MFNKQCAFFIAAMIMTLIQLRASSGLSGSISSETILAKMFEPHMIDSGSNSSSPSQQSSGPQRHSYFTLMAGVKPYNYDSIYKQGSYIGYLLNLAATRYVLDRAGATADFNILMSVHNVRLSNETTEMLPAKQRQFFATLNMIIEPLVFVTEKKQLSKFEILRFVQYDRVLYLDADTLPLCNLDYYFHLSTNSSGSSKEEPAFGPNLIFAYRTEPSNGGFFMLQPEPGDWETFQQIPPYIGQEMGFGHRLDTLVEGARFNYSKWVWYAAHSDQGLLYHWVRFIKKDYTHVVRNQVQRWREVGGNMSMVHSVNNFTISCSNEVPVTRHLKELLEINPVYRHFLHFTGKKKAWMWFVWNNTAESLQSEGKFLVDPLNYFNVWGHAVREAWRRYKLGSIRELFPNPVPASLEGEVDMIQRFLDS